MGVDKGNWFSNQKEVSEKVQGLDSRGKYAAGGETINSGAIDPLSGFVFITGATITLADGERDGQILNIKRLNIAGSSVVTPTTLYDGATITFTAKQYCELAWYDDGTYTGWMVVGGNATVA